MNLYDLVIVIQPSFNRAYSNAYMSEYECIELNNALEAYKQKGGDLSYFTNGAGAPGNCTVM